MIQGKWTLISGEQEGVEIPEEDLAKYGLVISDNHHYVNWSNSVLEGTHTIDASQSPISIDSTDAAGPFEGMCLKGIIETSGNEFSICFAAPGEPRPTEFTTKNKKAIVLHRWKRKV